MIAGRTQAPVDFQSTTRIELGGHITQRKGAKLPVMISASPHSDCSCDSKLRKYVLLSKMSGFQRIIDFCPRQPGGGSESYLHTLIGQFLHSNIERTR